MADNEFRIESDSPANKDLKFWRIVGHEGLARPSSYELTVLSESRTIEPTDILGRAFDVVIEFFDPDEVKHERHAQGHAVRFARGAQIGRYFEYRISLRSWFWLLTKRTNSRILQDKKVLEVLDTVFEDSPIKRFKKVKSGGVRGTHEPRRYCVQYQESDYQFLSRILEDEGIYYWFDAHGAPGTMHLSDASDMAHPSLPVTDTLEYVADGVSEARFNEIERWTTARQLQSGKYASRDVNYKAIKKLLSTGADVSDNHELSDLEVFEYPGGYFTAEEADTVLSVRADELDTRNEPHWAVTHWPDVAVGRSFTFKGDPDGTRDGDYIIAGCTFAATHPGYEGLGEEGASQPIHRVLHEALAADAVNAGCLDALLGMIETTPTLRNGTRGTSTFLITALSAKKAFRPPRLTPRVTMPGPQSAIVVGGKGKELDVDDMGRVKVHFHWDRYDESDDKSTCWIRVSQPWAGKGWGGYFMPRVKQEVIVDFMNGDPDRPIIVGRVYNDDQPIPYQSATQSGFKTRSTPGGGPSNYNEIMFEDKKGSELVNVHAERNMSTSVEVDDSTSVGHDQSITVQNDRTVLTVGNEKREVVKDQRNIVHQHQHTTVTWNQYNHVGKHQQNIVGADGQLNQVAGKVENIVGQTMSTQVTGAMTQKSASLGIETGPMTLASASFVLTAKGEMHMTAGATKLSLATTEITSKGDRSDWVAGTHKFKATDFKYFGTNFNRTVMQANDCVMGPNSNAYIGIASDTKLALARSVFIGLNMATALSVDISNFIGVKLENALAIKVATAAGLSADMSAVRTFSPGAGGAGAASEVKDLVGGAAAVAKGAAALAGLAGAGSVLYDGYKAIQQYEEAATECEAEGMTELARLARKRAGMVKGALIGAAVGAGLAPGAAIPGAIIGGIVGDATSG